MASNPGKNKSDHQNNTINQDPALGYKSYVIENTNEKYMCDRQLNYFRNLLQHWREQLRHGVDNTLLEMREAASSVIADPNDRATQEESFNLELRARDRERKLLKKIEDTIKQIDAKEYGYCETCGIEIGIKRLEARPTASLCFDCKSIAEIKEKRS